MIKLPHVSWNEAQDVIECNFIPYYLAVELFFAQLTGILMRPRVARDLMSIPNHALHGTGKPVVCVSGNLDSLLTLIYPDHG